MAYEPKLPEGVTLPEGHRIDTADERYRQLEAVATAHKWSQAAFSDVLGVEARRVASEHARSRAGAPTPAPPAAKPKFATMSTREQFAHSLAHGSTPSKRG
jgi:hypothetical protein